MNETEIRKYAELMRELGLTGLEITEDKKTLRLERSVPFKEQAIAPAPVSPAETEKAETDTSTDIISVKSPFVGVFYASPAENTAPYVSAGSHVKKGQILCIVEAMKLMNEITAEEDGVITRVCAASGQVVEYGTELFRIRR